MIKDILLVVVLILFFSGFKPIQSKVTGTYLCDNKLQLEELRISDNEFSLYHNSHVDGIYQRMGKVEFSGDTIKLIENSNTVKSTDNLLEFHSRLICRKEHLFVIIKGKKGDYIKNSAWNYSKTSNNYSNTKPGWYKE